MPCSKAGDREECSADTSQEIVQQSKTGVRRSSMIRRYRTHEIRIRRLRWIAALVLLWVVPVVCQTPQPQADVEARVDSLLKQLSLEEKIDLIGGVNDYYIRDIPHIHLPRMKMSDGPVGVRNYG